MDKHFPPGSTLICKHYAHYACFGIFTGSIRIRNGKKEYEFERLWCSKISFEGEYIFNYYNILTPNDYFFYRCSKCKGTEPKQKDLRRGVCLHCGRLETLKNMKERNGTTKE